MDTQSDAGSNQLARVRRRSARRDSLHALLREEGGYRLVSEGSGVRAAEVWIPESTGSPADVIKQNKELHQIGSGTTEFQVHPELMLDLLECVKIAPSAKTPDNAEVWLDDDALEEWANEDAEMPSIDTPEGLWIDPLWIRVNGARATVLRSSRRSALILHRDWDEGMSPAITDEYLSWSFYGESGGPCTFDGGASLGRSGSVLALHQWGDYNPMNFVAFHPAHAQLARELTNWIWSLDWELPFLRAEVGFPGLTPNEAESIWGNDDLEGTQISSSLSSELAEDIVRRLCRRSPQLRAAAHALRHPRSKRGTAAYGWARLLAGENWHSSTWEYVDRALLGQIDPPGPDPSPRSLSAIMQERMDKVEAEMFGWAQAVPVDHHIASALKELAATRVSPDGSRQRISELEARAEQIPVEQVHARELLRVTDETRGKSLWEAYERRSAEDPDREADYLDAYHCLHNPLGFTIEECRSQIGNLTQELAAVEALREEAVASGWPDQWDPRVLPIWTSLGGTVASAAAWASLGWSPSTVLTDGQLKLPWNQPISARVTNLAPPEPPTQATA